MRFKCNHCGRIFKEKCAHDCNTGFRKRNKDWTIVDLDNFEKFYLKSLKGFLDTDLIPLFGGRTSIREVSDELARVLM